MTVATYFGKLETLWDELDKYNPVPACICGISEEFMKRRDEEKFHDFLFGINQERFGHLRSQLLAQDPLPTLDWAYKAMNQEEQIQKRNQVASSDSPDVMTFAIKAPHKSTAEYKSRFLPNLTCTYCQRIGHDESTCFGKIGFPEWWGDRPQVRGKFGPERGAGRGRGAAGREQYSQRAAGREQHRPRAAEARAVACPGTTQAQAGACPGPKQAAAPGGSGSNTGIPGVSSEQIQQLISLLGNTPMNDRLDGEFSSNLWLIDTGASNHVTGNLSLLSDVCDMSACTVGLPDGSRAVSVKYGTVRLSSSLILRNVYYVPDFLCNLISVSHLTDDIDCVVYCVRSCCYIQDRRSRTLIGLGERKGGLFYLRGGCDDQVHRVVVQQDPSLWHQRMGHPSAKIVKTLPFDFLSSDMLNKTCDVCCQAKQSRECFQLSDNKASVPFELLHCDLWGPYHTLSSCGARFFLTIVDDFTRCVCGYFY